MANGEWPKQFSGKSGGDSERDKHRESIPPLGTKVTVILEPVLKEKKDKK